MIPSFPLSLLRLRQGFGLQRRPGLPYLPQPALTEGQFLRQLIPTLVPAVTVVLEIWPESGGGRVSGYTWGQQV